MVWPGACLAANSHPRNSRDAMYTLVLSSSKTCIHNKTWRPPRKEHVVPTAVTLFPLCNLILRVLRPAGCQKRTTSARSVWLGVAPITVIVGSSFFCSFDVTRPLCNLNARIGRICGPWRMGQVQRSIEVSSDAIFRSEKASKQCRRGSGSWSGMVFFAERKYRNLNRTAGLELWNLRTCWGAQLGYFSYVFFRRPM